MKTHPGFAAIFFVILVTACQPLSGTPLPTATQAIPSTTQPELIPTHPPTAEQSLPPAYTAVRVAYASQGQLWTWENGKAMALTRANPDTPLVFSSDGEQIAFIRDGELLTIHSDGGDEQVLIPAQELASIAPQNPAKLVHFSWVPGRPLLLVSTLADSGVGLRPNQDLFLLDVDTGGLKAIFPPGEGGLVYPSPDGAWLAVVSPERLLLMRPDGSDQRIALTYPPYQGDHFPTISRPDWAADSLSCILKTRSDESTTTWQIPVTGEASILLRPAYQGLSFAPDLSRYAYILDAGMLDSLIELHIANSDGTKDYVHARANHEDYTGLGFLGWAPDSLSFLFSDTEGNIKWMQVGGTEAQILDLPPSEPLRAVKFLWLDAARFVVALRSPGGIWLGAPGEGSLQIADFPEGDFMASDLGRGFDLAARYGSLP